MSVFVPGRARCSCGEEIPISLADSLHVSGRPDLRAAIFEETLHRFTCPACGTGMRVEKLLAYTDFERRHWITVFPEQDIRFWSALSAQAEQSFHQVMEVNAPELVRAWSPSFTRRVVFGLGALREKLIVFDAGLDDRYLELLKLMLVRDLGLTLSPNMYLRLHGVLEDQLLYHAEPPSPNEGSVRRELYVRREVYEKMKSEPASWQDVFPELFASPVVDFRLAMIAPAALPPLLERAP